MSFDSLTTVTIVAVTKVADQVQGEEFTHFERPHQMVNASSANEADRLMREEGIWLWQPQDTRRLQALRFIRIFMEYDLWAVQSTNLEKDKEFVLVFRNSSLTPGEKGWQEASVPMSEEQLKEALRKLNVPEAKVNEEIVRARRKA